MYWKLKWCQTNRSMKKFWYFEYHSIQKMTKSIKIEKKLYRVNLSDVNFQYEQFSSWQSTSHKNNHYDTSTSIFEFENVLFMISCMSFYSESLKSVIFIWSILTNSTIYEYRVKYETFNEKIFYCLFNIFNQLSFSYFRFFSLFCFSNEFKIRWLIIKIHHDVFHWFLSLENFFEIWKNANNEKERKKEEKNEWKSLYIHSCMKKTN